MEELNEDLQIVYLMYYVHVLQMHCVILHNNKLANATQDFFHYNGN